MLLQKTLARFIVLFAVMASTPTAFGQWTIDFETTVEDVPRVRTVGPLAFGGSCEKVVKLTGNARFTPDVDIDLIDVGIDIAIQWILNALTPPAVSQQVSATVPKCKSGELHAEITLEKAVTKTFYNLPFGIRLHVATVTVIGPKANGIKGVIKNLKDLDCDCDCDEDKDKEEKQEGETGEDRKDVGGEGR